MLKYRSVTVLVGTLSAIITATPAHALVADGVTYTLTETMLSATTAQFDLHITGINGATDTEGGRSGVEAFGFNQPTGFVSGTSSGFTEQSGGSNANGCDGSGNFFCFKANNTPLSTPALPADSIFDIVFDLTVSSSGNFAEFGAGQDDSFKIDWVGSKNHYDLVSQDLPVPAPPIGRGLPVLLAVGGMLFGAKLLGRRSRRQLLGIPLTHTGTI